MRFLIKRSSLLSILILICLFLFNPFIIRGGFIDPVIIYPIFLSLFIGLVFIYLRRESYDKKVTKVEAIVVGIFICYFVYHYIFNFDYSFFLIQDVIILCFLFFVYKCLDDFNVLMSFLILWKKFVIVICWVVIVVFAMQYLVFFKFESTEIGGYYVLFNPLGGLVHRGMFFPRPSFYFAEPSYLGFFLGFNFFFFKELIFKRKASKMKMLVLLFVSGCLGGSLTFYIAFAVSIIVDFFVHSGIKLSRYFLSKAYIIGQIFFLCLLPILDVQNIDVSKTSAGDRQERQDRSFEILEKASAFDFMLGHGTNYIAENYEKGESNSYLRILIENGMIMFLCYLFFLYITLRENSCLFLFCLLALNTVVVYMFPLMLVSFILCSLYQSYKEKMLVV